jgi:hypothetical protein
LYISFCLSVCLSLCSLSRLFTYLFDALVRGGVLPGVWISSGWFVHLFKSVCPSVCISLSVPSLACSFTFSLHKFEQGFFPGSGSLQVGLYISFCLSLSLFPLSLIHLPFCCTSLRRGSTRDRDHSRLVCTSLSVCLSLYLSVSLSVPSLANSLTFSMQKFEEGFFPGSGPLQIGL